MRDAARTDASPEIAAFLADYVVAYGSGDLDALRPFYSDHTLIWPNQRPSASGRDGVLAMFGPSFAQHAIAARVHLLEERGSGDERFLRFLTEVRLAPKDGSAPLNAFFRDFALVLRSEGRWTILRNIDQPITPEQLASDLVRDPPLAVIGEQPQHGDHR
jgi:ketosteroid isomerase-like protein